MNALVKCARRELSPNRLESHRTEGPLTVGGRPTWMKRGARVGGQVYSECMTGRRLGCDQEYTVLLRAIQHLVVAMDGEGAHMMSPSGTQPRAVKESPCSRANAERANGLTATLRTPRAALGWQPARMRTESAIGTPRAAKRSTCPS